MGFIYSSGLFRVSCFFLSLFLGLFGFLGIRVVPWDFMKTGRRIQPQRRLGATNSVQLIDLGLGKELVRGHVGRRLAFRVPFGILGRDQ